MSTKPMLLTMGLEGDFAGMVEDNRARHEEYCERHGYDFRVLDTLDTKSSGWSKIKALREIMVPGGPEFVAYIDSDAVVADMDKDLRECGLGLGWLGLVIHPYGWGYEIWHWNAGVMYWRNCYESRLFLECMWKDYGSPIDGSWDEQSRINRMMLEDRYWQAGMVTLPHHWNCNMHNQPTEGVVVAAWHGDGGADNRRRKMREWLAAR